MRVTSQQVYDQLIADLAQSNSGAITFSLSNVDLVVKQPNVVGNIIEEWLDQWMTSHNFDHVYNHEQASPDFWLDPDNRNHDWLEIKSFQGAANFDVGNYMSYINEVIEKPWKLDADYLCIRYSMNEETGEVRITNVWIKKVWEICCGSERWAVKVQDRRGVINNIRPANWYGRHKYRTFDSLEHFLSALDYVIKTYPPTAARGLRWRESVSNAYRDYKGEPFSVPLWQDIAAEYDPAQEQ